MPIPINGTFVIISLFFFCTTSKMEATIDLEFLLWINELVIKELAVVSDGVVQTFLFRPPYYLEPHGSKENGLYWSDGYIPYDKLQTVLSEAVAIYDHLYDRGEDKCELLNGILNRPIHNYEDLEFPDPMELMSDVHCYLTCHRYPNIRCASRNAYALHCWLLYHFKTKSYIKYPCNHGRHSVQFASGVPKPNTVIWPRLFQQYMNNSHR
jgi:hypothetical protein